jgi:predicted hydrolase (HD superfamily)
MEWSLYTCDELTGLIVAVALVKGRNLSSVTVESVLKKFPQKSFAAGVEREQIAMCQEKLNIELNRFIQIVLEGMQKISKELGL